MADERDLDPGRAVAGLVDHLVQRLVELEGAQQDAVVARVVPAGLGVGGEERVARTPPSTRRPRTLRGSTRRAGR